ncbi:MAG: hypothetical protein GTO63_20785 [Anaerolineae bacterium]|nr:hypothetical protein [Anaerolineae bacterium]NIN97216.1 hypothetical protein [Anaerolineae bacterium]NIQ80169.1 hypothetical protein [Anaerolineae bacterium]
MNRRSFGRKTDRSDGVRQLVDLLPLILLSVLIALLATAAGPASKMCFFQSPISPIAPPEASPAAPQVTATPRVTVEGPALVAVPTAPNFIPWAIGLLVIVIVVGSVMYWRQRREGGEDNE